MHFIFVNAAYSMRHTQEAFMLRLKVATDGQLDMARVPVDWARDRFHILDDEAIKTVRRLIVVIVLVIVHFV